MARYLTRKGVSPSVECVRNVDNFLQKITPSIPVDLMPGSGDPTNHMLPQQALHRCMFPLASKCGPMLNLTTNPYHCEVGGRRLMGTAGQNLADLVTYTGTESESDRPIDMLERLFTWQHLCPTAPDTLDTFPFQDRDPFIIDTPIDIFFAGNQNVITMKDMAKRIHVGGRETLLLCLPKFKATANLALIVNLRNFDVILQDFTISD